MNTNWRPVLIMVGLGAALNTVPAMNVPAVNEVLKMKAAGLDELTIVAFIKNKNQPFDLLADDTISLRNQGVSSGILNAMLASGTNMTSPLEASLPTITTNQVIVAAPQVVQPSSPAVVVQPAISADAAYFYQELSPYGRWILAEDNQWYWQPTVAISDPDWRPYWNKGHWISTEDGWYWASDYPWGWAPFHYGRWYLHPHHLWIWLPDRIWAPSWVVWRSGGEYCGWAPLPPGARFEGVSGHFTYRGKVVEAGFDFGLDWMHFSFTYLREIGEPPRHHFRKEQEIRSVFRKTIPVNHYTMVRKPDHDQPRVYGVNRGLDPKRVSDSRGKPVETVRIEDLRSPPRQRTRERPDQGNRTMQVYRPRIDEPHRH